MTHTEFVLKYPEYQRYSTYIEMVEINDPSTGLILSKGYIVRFYKPADNNHFAAVTLTLDLIPDPSNIPNITMHYPSDINSDELLLYSVIRIKENRREARLSFLEANPEIMYFPMSLVPPLI